jgi:hypothetical protein
MSYPSTAGGSSALAVPEGQAFHGPGNGLSDLSYLIPPEETTYTGYPDDDYTAAPKFQKDAVLETVAELVAEHSMRIVQAREYSHFLDCTSPGVFEDDADLVEGHIAESMSLLGPREDYEFRCGFLASHDAYTRLLNRDMIDRDEALIVEDLATHLFECEERQYARNHHADLRLAEPAHLLRFGALIGLDVLDPEDTTCGLAMDLLDPLTVFPVFGGPGGISEVYRVYEDTNERIIGAYGGKPGSKEWQRIQRKVNESAAKVKKGKRNYTPRGQKRTVTEAYSRDEFYVILDEEVELLRRKHGYREVPITIRIGAFDQPAGVNLGASTQWSEPQVMNTDWGDVTVSDASLDLARQWRPFAYRQMAAHRIAEAVAGRQLSIFKWAINPHKIVEYDPSTQWKMADEINLLPGETTRIPLPNKLNLITPVVDPNIMAGMASNLQSNQGGGFLTQMRLGQIPPQTSGSAMSKMQQLGGAGEITLVKAIQGFKQDRTELRLRLLGQFGDAVGAPLGVVRTPRREGARTPVSDATPELLQRAGYYVSTELYNWTPDVPMAQYIMTLRTPSPLTGKPLISDGTAQRALKFTPDIEREADRINDEALSALPPVQQQRHLARLHRDLEEAQDSGDHDSAADLMVAIAELEFLHEQQIMGGQAAPPPGMAPPMGAGGTPNQMPAAPPPGGGGGPALPGNSLPDMGIGVGQEGGPPMGGSSAPPPITPVAPPSGGTQGGR